MLKLDKKIEEDWKAMLEMLAIYGRGRPLWNTVAENLFLLRQVTQPLCYEKPSRQVIASKV